MAIQEASKGMIFGALAGTTTSVLLGALSSTSLSGKTFMERTSHFGAIALPISLAMGGVYALASVTATIENRLNKEHEEDIGQEKVNNNFEKRLQGLELSFTERLTQKRTQASVPSIKA